jgi:hypothetical protein
MIESQSQYDGLLLFTAFGLVVGKPFMPLSLSDNPTVSEIICQSKEEIVYPPSKNKEQQYELIGDGSMIILRDAVIKYSFNSTIKINEITVHCSDIIGFSPINIHEFLTQC